MSPPEVLLWTRLRRKGLGFVVRRQAPLGPYFADFFVPHVQLDIEVDGKGHEQGLQYENDEVRTAWMEQQGIAVLRIPAADVMRDVSSVVECIQGEIDRLLEEQP